MTFGRAFPDNPKSKMPTFGWYAFRMELYLGHTTSLEAWRQWSDQPKVLSAPPYRHANQSPKTPQTLASSGSLRICAANERAVCDILRRQNLVLNEPLHILVPGSCKPHSTADIRFHRCFLALPEKSFRKVADQVFLSSPELTFVQLATTLSLPHLISIGYEMCGNYIGPSGSKRAALTTKQRLAAYAQKASALHGSKAARRAAQYVLNGSASPMETAVAMELTLPYALGGKNLPNPKLNKAVELSPAAAVIARRKHLVYDLFWPQRKLVVEYDSRAHHSNDEARIKDSQKRAAAAESGITLISITERQYRNIAEFDEIAHVIARKLDCKIYPRVDDYLHKRFLLRSQLQHLHNQGIVDQ